MDHMSTGYTALHDDMIRSLAYVSFQELATRVSHRNTGKTTGDAVGDQLLAAHEHFRLDNTDIPPAEAARAIADVLR